MKYVVTLPFSGVVDVEVEAGTEEEAEVNARSSTPPSKDIANGIRWWGNADVEEVVS